MYWVLISCISGQEVMNAVKHWSHKSLFLKIFYAGYLSKCCFYNVLENFDDIVDTVGSNGSVSGIAIGNY